MPIAFFTIPHTLMKPPVPSSTPHVTHCTPMSPPQYRGIYAVWLTWLWKYDQNCKSNLLGQNGQIIILLCIAVWSTWLWKYNQCCKNDLLGHNGQIMVLFLLLLLHTSDQLRPSTSHTLAEF